jgi:hypothetical protein
VAGFQLKLACLPLIAALLGFSFTPITLTESSLRYTHTHTR